MILSRLHIAQRLAIAVGVPILGLLAFACLFVQQHREEADRMGNIAELTEFGGHLSEVIHELQRERGNSAGFIGSGGAGEFATRLEEQRLRTDVTIERYQAAYAQMDLSRYSDAYAQQLTVVNGNLAGLASHRATINDLDINTGDAVRPYTQTIDSILSAFIEEVHEADDGGLTEGMISLLNLMQAKENAGIERAVGAGSLAVGQVSTANHQRLFELQAVQEAFIYEFSGMMGAGWASRLERAIEPTAADVEHYRAILRDGGYGANVPSGQGGAMV